MTTWQNCLRKCLRVHRFGQLKLGSASWQKEEDQRKGFNTAGTLIHPNVACISEQCRTFRNTLVDPTLQDNVLLPTDFAEYIYHIGNAHDMHSVIQCGLIPGGRSHKGQAVSVFHSREPEVPQTRSVRSPIRFGRTQNRSEHHCHQIAVYRGTIYTSYICSWYMSWRRLKIVSATR